MTEKRERKEITADTVKVLVHNQYGYSGSGVFPLTDNYFYRITDKAGNVYTASTSKQIWPEDKFVASVVGENNYKGEKQIKLTRVSFLEFGPNRPKFKSTYIGNLISTDGEY